MVSLYITVDENEDNRQIQNNMALMCQKWWCANWCTYL